MDVHPPKYSKIGFDTSPNGDSNLNRPDFTKHWVLGLSTVDPC